MSRAPASFSAAYRGRLLARAIEAFVRDIVTDEIAKRDRAIATGIERLNKAVEANGIVVGATPDGAKGRREVRKKRRGRGDPS